MVSPLKMRPFWVSPLLPRGTSQPLFFTVTRPATRPARQLGKHHSAHLHFHIMDASLPLGADRNLPHVFDSFRYQGRIGDDLMPVLLDTPEQREIIRCLKRYS
jgi:hypothetical protein